MSRDESAFRRAVLVAVDVMGYGQGDDRQQMDVQRDLLTVLQWASDGAGVSRERWDRHPEGDGELAVLPPDVPERRVVGQFVQQLSAALTRRNEDDRSGPRLRLRLAIHHGVVAPADNGLAGQGVVAVKRLVDCAPVRAALRSSGADLAVVVSAQVFNEMIAQRHTTLRPADFRQVHVEVKEYTAPAWIWVPGIDPAVLDLPADRRDQPQEAAAAAATQPKDRPRQPASATPTIHNEFHETVTAENATFGIRY
ncbi:hypothetical protein [Parafrankia sp. EUN1f]|uniref:hypothetical protein n=1 Tax=Parafrankia sp. EUN1f TaxID=102897 RepID=UPI0012FA8251|nr:hypothetical protein [Parafrankia sp. EUN1f]